MCYILRMKIFFNRMKRVPFLIGLVFISATFNEAFGGETSELFQCKLQNQQTLRLESPQDIQITFHRSGSVSLLIEHPLKVGTRYQLEVPQSKKEGLEHFTKFQLMGENSFSQITYSELFIEEIFLQTVINRTNMSPEGQVALELNPGVFAIYHCISAE